jgi:hypothetical protein
MRPRFRARAIGLVTTAVPISRVFQRLEPIADVLRDILVLAMVAGGDNRCQPGDLRGYYE